MRYLETFFILFLILSSCNQKQKKEKSPPAPVIFDTDIGPDYDDVGAITILHKMAENREATILATVASNKYEGIAAVLDVFNTYWNQPNIPIGVPKGKAVDKNDSQHWTDSLLAKYPHKINSNDEVPDAVEIYRKVLAAQPDTSVIIVSVGFLTNLANLLGSRPDQYSSLDGTQLVKKKIKKLVSMAGAFPSGKEFNVYNDAPASKEVFENWPTPVLFSGFEIGRDIITGLPLVQNESLQNNPAKDAYRIAIPQSPVDSAGRMSWDLTAVLVGVRGINPWFTLKEGKIWVNEDGSNDWDKNGKGQYYLVFKEGRKRALTDTLNALMQMEPDIKR